MIPIVLAMAVATKTPIPSVKNAEVRYRDSGGHHYVVTAQRLSSIDFAAAVLKGSGAWIVTATVTATPTPNAEATCVAVGHMWINTNGWNHLCQNESNPHMDIEIQLCRRCRLWREKP